MWVFGVGFLGGCTQKNPPVFWVRTRVSEPCCVAFLGHRCPATVIKRRTVSVELLMCIGSRRKLWTAYVNVCGNIWHIGWGLSRRVLPRGFLSVRIQDAVPTESIQHMHAVRNGLRTVDYCRRRTSLARLGVRDEWLMSSILAGESVHYVLPWPIPAAYTCD